MNVKNYVDVAGLKSRIDELHRQHDESINAHPGGVDIPEGDQRRSLPDDKQRVLVNEAVNAAAADIIRAVKEEVFALVHED